MRRLIFWGDKLVNCSECGKELDVEYEPGVNLIFCSEECSEKFHDRDNKLRKERGLQPLIPVISKKPLMVDGFHIPINSEYPAIAKMRTIVNHTNECERCKTLFAEIYNCALRGKMHG